MKKNIVKNIHILFNIINKGNYNFFTGVPDSALKEFIFNLPNDNTHVVAPHESQAVGIAVGAFLAGKNPCIYLQNSGLGNIINPLTSLCIPFGIEPLLIIGHRHTLSQHKVMGEIDKKLIELLNYKNYILYCGENNEK